RLAELDPTDQRLAELEAEEARLAEEARKLAARLTASRREAADRFAAAVSEELKGLAMPHARIEVAVNPRPDGELAIDGADEVELRLIAHPGAPALPLQKGASGGELSRVMLAIEVVFAGAGGPETLVFDE